MTDSVLQRIAAGETAAVNECLDRYGGLVWSLAKRMIGNLADAEDAVQEIFVELWQQSCRFDPSVAGEATFVAMIARRRLIDRLRKDSRRPLTETIDREPADIDRPSPESSAQWGDEAAKAARCLERLSSIQQEILTLAVHHGATHTMISGRLSMPLGTVKSYARRGLIQLRDCMQRTAPFDLNNASSTEIPSASTAIQGSRS